MKIKLTIIVLLFFTGNVLSQQTKCELNIADSPKLRGFSLQTTKKEILKILPKTVIPASDEYGASVFSLHFFPLPDRLLSNGDDEAPNSIDTSKSTDYKGLEKIEFELLDEKVAILKVQYDTSVKWKEVEEFVDHISQALKLPNAWKYQGKAKSSNLMFMECSDFDIEAEISNGNAILRLVNVEAPNEYKKRSQTAEEKTKKQFKP